MIDNYSQFITKKQTLINPSGFITTTPFIDSLFDWQQKIVEWALLKGRACLFEDCGLGKTIQQLEWARHVHVHTEKPVLILAPIAVSQQTINEGKKFGISVNHVESDADIINGINITNYEKLHRFNGYVFGGVVLDESSILKNFSGHYRNLIIETFRATPYKLACTATPAPNDYMELGNHAEFLGVMTLSEMLSMFFVNDMSDNGTWRLKKHAKEREFWKWVCGWAVMLNNPADIGYGGDGFDLPELRYHEIIVPAVNKSGSGLFNQDAQTLDERRIVRRESIEPRVAAAAEIINKTDEQWVVWCNLNTESEMLTKQVHQATEITGSQDITYRANKMLRFAKGDVLRIVTKPTIAGFGMNWQNCNKMAFVGLSDSWEQLYQAVRRCWRFGQQKPVDVYIIIEEREGKVLQNIKRKDLQAKNMMKNMIAHVNDLIINELTNQLNSKTEWKEQELQIPKWMH